MRLNPDCVRDILLTVEEITDFNTYWNFSKYNILDDRLKKYSPEEFIYHVHQCYKANLIDDCRFYDAGETGVIGDLTPYGHQFLSNIREDANWNKTKEIAKRKLGFHYDFSYTAIAGIKLQIHHMP